MKLILAAMVASTAFVPVTLPDEEGICAAEGALACVELAPTDGAVRVQSEPGARYEIHGAGGVVLARGPIEGDGMIGLPAGAARVVVFS